MGGHVIIRSQIRDAASDPLNQAAMPDYVLPKVQEILAKSNADWDEHDCSVLTFALHRVACDNPNS